MSSSKLQQPLHGPGYDMRALGFGPGEAIVVSGAASGIGRATALMAAQSGLSVGVWDMDIEGARAVVREIEAAGGKAVPVSVDVGSDAAVTAAWEATAALGPCRYLVNNAGPASSSTASFEHNLLLAVGSVQRVTTSWLERYASAATSVVNLSSVIGNFQGAAASAAFYPAAKAGIAGYTRHLATRHAGKPRANAVAPGFIVTPRTQPFLDNPAMRENVARIPAGRLGVPEDVASVILFLLSPAAVYVNGVLLPVDGGWIHA